MTKKYKILGKYIKDMSSETPDIETYIFVKDRISKYQLAIDINSKALKNKMIEINTVIKFEDKEESAKKSYFEINFSTIILGYLILRLFNFSSLVPVAATEDPKSLNFFIKEFPIPPVAPVIRIFLFFKFI